MQRKTTNIFISYSDDDRSSKDELVQHLIPLADAGRLDLWHDGLIQPGENRETKIKQALDAAEVAVLLVSKSFLASTFCTKLILPQIITAHDTRKLRIIPILLGHCVWEHSTAIASLKLIPHDEQGRAKPVRAWPESEREAVFASLARNIIGTLTTQNDPMQPSHLSTDRISAWVPYPRELTDELEQLTRERQMRHPAETPTDTDRRQRRIDAIVASLRSYRAPGSNDLVAGVRLARIVGKGTFGAVWEGIDEASGTPRAVKIFDADRLGLGTALVHFRRGVRAMEHLNRDSSHRPASVVRLYSVEPNRLAFSMQYMENGDLVGIAAHGWTLERKISIFSTICEAVRFAHSNEVIHRDIKPANVVMSVAGTPVLTDFDIADLLFTKTLSITAGGSTYYAAPEQLAGSSRGEPLADIYSLGRLLHFLLIEEDPKFTFEEVPLLNDSNLKSLPIGLVRIIRKCTMRNPMKRYHSVTSLLFDLSRRKKSWQVGRGKNEITKTFLAICIITIGTYFGFAQIFSGLKFWHSNPLKHEASLAPTAHDKLNEIINGKEEINRARQLIIYGSHLIEVSAKNASDNKPLIGATVQISSNPFKVIQSFQRSNITDESYIADESSSYDSNNFYASSTSDLNGLVYFAVLGKGNAPKSERGFDIIVSKQNFENETKFHPLIQQDTQLTLLRHIKSNVWESGTILGPRPQYCVLPISADEVNKTPDEKITFLLKQGTKAESPLLSESFNLERNARRPPRQHIVEVLALADEDSKPLAAAQVNIDEVPASNSPIQYIDTPLIAKVDKFNNQSIEPLHFVKLTNNSGILNFGIRNDSLSNKISPKICNHVIISVNHPGRVSAFRLLAIHGCLVQIFSVKNKKNQVSSEKFMIDMNSDASTPPSDLLIARLRKKNSN